ncbi:hypothetical protein [Allobranchiibius sp. CTAmp26]|uniref:hypothetical protein n=1 Tax=Allobranchiibius sp. CTAmp26 TaxID=2815214 RepID=UPI001AA1B709|nr:hypothetical protein [Allobranchiibius sp. CTAmp26]MBO1754205.1 hypothetical protein [Allobranchiibius sp. CTAmp26]
MGSIDWSTIGHNTLKVIAVGVVLGAGLPFLFAVGIRLWDQGSGGEHADGTMTAGKPAALTAAYILSAIIALVVIYGVLYITKSSLDHYLGIKLPT